MTEECKKEMMHSIECFIDVYNGITSGYYMLDDTNFRIASLEALRAILIFINEELAE